MIFTQPPALTLLSCFECSHIFRNPREKPESVRSNYSNSKLGDDVYQSLFHNQEVTYRAQVRRLQTIVPTVQRGLGVGCYVGGFLAAARDAGLSFTGIDVNAEAAAFAAGNGFRTRVCAIEEVTTAQFYDANTIWNTFEQLPDVVGAAIVCRRLLLPVGLFVIRVPNAEFYMRWRDRINGAFGSAAERMLVHNNLLGFPCREGFTENSIRRLLQVTGFKIRHVYGDTLSPLADCWTTRKGAVDEIMTKKLQKMLQHGWNAPWLEIFATPDMSWRVTRS